MMMKKETYFITVHFKSILPYGWRI